MTLDQAIESGNEPELRGEWLSRLMFGWIIGQRDPGPYEEWLAHLDVDPCDSSPKGL